MRKILVLCIGALLIGTAASAKEYAIIRNTMFGGQKIEVYKSLNDALDNYSGQGKIYEITLTPVPLKRVESKKRIEVSEFRWTVDEKYEKPEKGPKAREGGEGRQERRTEEIVCRIHSVGHPFHDTD
ncbi:MAG: hypothetical protein MZU95_09620 [Desulfomicrobium escambiense]|nr:hypothetical protein [Desulfomicrobium escambiense]